MAGAIEVVSVDQPIAQADDAPGIGGDIILVGHHDDGAAALVQALAAKP